MGFDKFPLYKLRLLGILDFHYNFVHSWEVDLYSLFDMHILIGLGKLSNRHLQYFQYIKQYMTCA